MMNQERGSAESWFLKVFRLSTLGVQFLRPRIIRAFWHLRIYNNNNYRDALENSERSSEKLFYPALFVQQIKDAQFRFDKIDTGLIVIEVYESPFDLLPKIFLLL